MEAEGASLTLLDTMENDKILTQFVADTGTTVTDMECLNEIVEEVDPDKFIVKDLSAALEVTDSRMLVDNDEATVCQQSELLVDLDAEDKSVVAVVNNDVSMTVDVHLLPKDDDSLKPHMESGDAVTCKCTEINSGQVVLSETQIFPSNSDGIDVIPASISQSFYEQHLQQDLIDGTDVNRAASLSVMDGKDTCLVDIGVNTGKRANVGHGSSLLAYHSSEAENVDMPRGGDLLKPGNEIDAPVVCIMKETLSEEDYIMSEENCDILSTNDIRDNMEEDGDILESSSVTDPQDESAKSFSPSHYSLPVEHVDDVQSSSSLGYHSSEAEIEGIFLLPENSLKPGDDNEPSVACSIKRAAYEEVSNILPTSDISHNMERDDSLLELSSVAEGRVYAAKSDTPSHSSQLVECIQCDENAVEPVQLLPSTDENMHAVNVSTATAGMHESASESDKQLVLSSKEMGAYAFEKCTTEIDVAKRDANSDAKSLHVSKMEVFSINSSDSCKEDVILFSGSGVVSQPVSHSSSVVLVSSTSLAGSAVISCDMETVNANSHKETDKSTVIIVRTVSQSTLPSTMFIPHSSSAVLSDRLQCITSTAANLVSSSVGSTLQYMMASAAEPKSTSTTYRPAAALAMNIGKNLVTESILREVVTQEPKWKDASNEEQQVLASN